MKIEASSRPGSFSLGSRLSQRPFGLPPFVNDAISFTGQHSKNRFHKVWPNGVARLVVRQGALPSCQTLSPIFALSQNPSGAKLLEGMIRVLPKGHFTVIFPGHPDKEIPVRSAEVRQKSWDPVPAIPETESTGFKKRLEKLLQTYNLSHVVFPQKPPRVSGDLGVRLLETAYARLNKALFPEVYADISEPKIRKIFKHKKYHYHPGTVLKDFTGWNVQTLVANGGAVIEESGTFAAEARQHPQSLRAATRLLDEFGKSPSSYVLVASSAGKPGIGLSYYLDSGRKILMWHDFAVIKSNPEAQTVQLADPHNTEVQLVLSYQTFFKYFSALTVANVPSH